MARVIFVSGGCRSGKSDFALKVAAALAESLGRPGVFVATCPVIDPEMDQRISKHREARDPARWTTIEEALELEAALAPLGDGTEQSVLVDCLSLWVNNLMYRDGAALDEAKIAKRAEAVLASARKIQGTVYFVSSEVGLGLVPESREGRRYRDLLGRVNQTVAQGADEAFFLVSGLPLKLK